MRADIETVIDGYTCWLELWEEDGKDRSSCWVERSIDGVKFRASLAYLDDGGALEAAVERGEHAVPNATIEKIMAWALDNGY